MEALIKIIADWVMVPLVLLAFYAFIFVVPKVKWKFWGVRIFLAGVTTYLSAKLLGLVYYFYFPDTTRPFERLGVNPGASYMDNDGFPSDHALFAMFLTLAVWFSTRNKYLALAMLVMTIVVAFGRVAALVHSPVDVLGGLLIPLVGVVWYISWSRRKAK